MTLKIRSKGTLFYAGLIALQCLLWGVGNPIMKIGISQMPPYLCLALRYLLATTLFFALFRRRCFKGLRQAHLPSLVGVCAFTVVSFVSANIALLHTSATNASFLMGMAVLFAPFLTPIFLKSRFDWGSLLPVGITVAGLYLLCGMAGVPRLGLGEWLGLLSACTGAASMVLSPRLLTCMNAVSLATTQSTTTGLCCFALSMLTEGAPKLLEIPAVSWLVVGYSAIGCTVIAYLLQNTALAHLDPSYVALLMCAEPVFAAGASFLLLDERMGLQGFFGALLILVSMVLASLRQERRESVQEQAAALTPGEPALADPAFEAAIQKSNA